MIKIEITTHQNELRVVSPFNLEFNREAKFHGGKWRAPAWVFDAREEARIREVCRRVYGTDGADQSNLVSLRVRWTEDVCRGHGPIELFGRVVARAKSRDSGARLGDGIILLEGGFDSGGSYKNWCTEVDAGTVVLIHDFPREKAEILESKGEQNNIICSIEKIEAKIDLQALLVERSALEKRLAEIGELISQAEAAEPQGESDERLC